MQTRFPQRFGQYILLHPLGSGGMGRVFLGVAGQEGLETLCVIKRMLPALLARPEHVERFRHEADLARRLVHGNLVHTHAVGQLDGEVFLVQEYVEGVDMMGVLEKLASQRRKLPVEVSVYVAASVARALEYAHDFERLELVHRDINPPNVRLTYDGEVKLLDFGIASSKLQGEEAKANKPIGKLAYMAPEQIEGQRVDRRTDLYALGVLLWEMLTGHPLGTVLEGGEPVLPDDGRSEIVHRVLDGDFLPPSAFNPKVSPDLDSTVLRLLAREPVDRFASAGELRPALMPHVPAGFNPERALAHEVARLSSRELERAERERLIVEARALPPPEPPEAPPQSPATGSSRRWLATAGVAAGMALAAVIGVGVLRSEERPTPPVVPRASTSHSIAREDPTIRGATAPLQPGSSTTKAAVEEGEADPGPTERPPPVPASRAARSKAPLRVVGGASPRAVRPPEPPSAPPAELDDLAIARSAFNDRNWHRALEHADRAARSGGGAKAYALLGATYFKLGRYDDAERAYQTASALNPSDDRLPKRLDFVRRTREKAAGRPTSLQSGEAP